MKSRTLEFNGKVQSYFNFVNSWIKTEQAYGTLHLSEQKLKRLLDSKCSENSTDRDEIDKLRKRNTISLQGLKSRDLKLCANYCGGLYPTRKCISKYYVFYDRIIVEDSLAYTSELECILKSQFMTRYENFHYYILSESVDFLRDGALKFIHQDWKQEKVGKESMGDLIAEHSLYEYKEIAQRSDMRIPIEISRNNVTEFLGRNIMVDNLKTEEFSTKRKLVDGVIKLAPIRKANVMSYLSLFNDGWPTSEFAQETHILRSKFDSFPSYNSVLPERIQRSVKLSSLLLKLELPFLEDLKAKDYVEMKRDAEAYEKMRKYLQKIADSDPLDLQKESRKIKRRLQRIGKEIGDFNEQYIPKQKRAFIRVQVPVYLCLLGNFFFPPLMVPASVWAIKEILEFFETLSEVSYQFKKIKQRNSLFNLWGLKEKASRRI